MLWARRTLFVTALAAMLVSSGASAAQHEKHSGKDMCCTGKTKCCAKHENCCKEGDKSCKAHHKTCCDKKAPCRAKHPGCCDNPDPKATCTVTGKPRAQCCASKASPMPPCCMKGCENQGTKVKK